MTESEVYKISVEFFRSDMSDECYEQFKKDIRTRFEENILPLSQGSTEARLVKIEVIENEKP